MGGQSRKKTLLWDPWEGVLEEMGSPAKWVGLNQVYIDTGEYLKSRSAKKEKEEEKEVEEQKEEDSHWLKSQQTEISTEHVYYGLPTILCANMGQCIWSSCGDTDVFIVPQTAVFYDTPWSPGRCVCSSLASLEELRRSYLTADRSMSRISSTRLRRTG